jgi:alpha-beta hydrolase superfamily lysophospholipase
MAERVTFHSEGIELTGYIHRPPGDRDRPRAAIVICHGFGAHQARYLPVIAERLAANGYVAMTLDYRGFGESAGPRWRLIPSEQVTDIRSALTYIAQQDGVDGRLGLWGTSFGGANVAMVAAVDERVACTVSVVGVGSGERWLRTLRRPWEWRDFLAEVEEDNRRRVLTGSSRIVDRLHVMLPDPVSRQVAEESMRQFPETCDRIPLESAQAVIDHHPERLVHLIAPRAILYVVAENDVLVPPDITRELYVRSGEPRGWEVIPGCGHYDVYGPPWFDQVVERAVAWYGRHLPATV